VITREQVADLQPGDVVELSFPSGSTIRGALTREGYSNSGLGITSAHWTVRSASGEVPPFIVDCSLTVVSRAPRPLYVNHPRTEAREHDVVRDGAGVIRHHGPVSESADATWWAWELQAGFRWTWTSEPAQPLHLLVDGETGQVVP
jgi:hypothetical protein